MPGAADSGSVGFVSGSSEGKRIASVLGSLEGVEAGAERNGIVSGAESTTGRRFGVVSSMGARWVWEAVAYWWETSTRDWPVSKKSKGSG